MKKYVICPSDFSTHNTLDKARIRCARLQQKEPKKSFRIYEISDVINPTANLEAQK